MSLSIALSVKQYQILALYHHHHEVKTRFVHWDKTFIRSSVSIMKWKIKKSSRKQTPMLPNTQKSLTTAIKVEVTETYICFCPRLHQPSINHSSHDSFAITIMFCASFILFSPLNSWNSTSLNISLMYYVHYLFYVSWIRI